MGPTAACLPGLVSPNAKKKLHKNPNLGLLRCNLTRNGIRDSDGSRTKPSGRVGNKKPLSVKGVTYPVLPED